MTEHLEKNRISKYNSKHNMAKFSPVLSEKEKEKKRNECCKMQRIHRPLIPHNLRHYFFERVILDEAHESPQSRKHRIRGLLQNLRAHKEIMLLTVTPVYQFRWKTSQDL